MTGGEEMEGRLGYESTADQALVWVGNRLETNFLVPWASLTIGDHWLSGAEYHRQNARDREKREKERRKTAERLMKADEAAIAREMKDSWLKRRGVE
jgi:hypothetical protein